MDRFGWTFLDDGGGGRSKDVEDLKWTWDFFGNIREGSNRIFIYNFKVDVERKGC